MKNLKKVAVVLVLAAFVFGGASLFKDPKPPIGVSPVEIMKDPKPPIGV